MKTILLSIIILLFFISNNFAQTDITSSSAITGSITVEGTLQTLPGVSVLIAGSNIGVSTDLDGKFNITSLSAGKYNLIISYIGFKTKYLDSLIVGKNEILDIGVIKLEESAVTLNEVTVSPGSFSIMGSKTVSSQTLSSKDLKNMSWAEDITRAVSRLPGVSSNDFSSKFTVRGGENDEILMNLDGMDLYEPFHQRDLGGGLFSIVDIETIRSIDLLTGGFSSEYGNRQSGVFNMNTKHIEEGRHTSVGLSIMNLRLYTDGTFSKNKGSYLFSARRGMLDQTFKIIGQDETTPIFYDMMAKAEYKLNAKHIISFHVLHSGDKTEIRDIKPENFDIHDTKYNNTYGWLTLRSYYNPKLQSRTLLFSGYIEHNRIGSFSKIDWADKGTFNLTDIRTYSFTGVKQDWDWGVNDRFNLKGGFDVRHLSATYDYHNEIQDIRVNSEDSLYNYSNLIDISANPSGPQINLYISNKFMIIPSLFMEAGLRYDYVSYTNDKLLSPRVSLAYAFSKTSFLRAAWGYYYQSQFINNLDVNHEAETFNSAELAIHYVLGFEHLFPKGISFRIETYYKDLSNISPNYMNLRDPWEVFPESRNDVVKVNIADARSKGVELFVKYDTGKKISWWLSYALAKAEDSIISVEFDGIFTEQTGYVNRHNNQLHTIYADLNYRPNNKWHISVSWQYYIGPSRTTYIYDYQILPDGEIHFYQKHGLFNGTPYPAYHRMDLRLNRHFIFDNSRLSAFAHVINLYDRKNLKKYDLGVEDDQGNLMPDGNGGYLNTYDHTSWLGLTPVIGVSWEF